MALYWWSEDIIGPPDDPEVVPPKIKGPLAAEQPLIRDTVGLTSPNHWSMGSLMLCSKLDKGEEMPAGVVFTWVDEGETYCIQKRETPKTTREPEGDPDAGNITSSTGHRGHVWWLSPNVLCKASVWAEGLTTEATTIRYINTHFPSVPTAEVMYEWIDTPWDRILMIIKKVPGILYRDAWRSLNMKQKLSIAEQVAGHCAALATKTSNYVETVEGTGVDGAYCIRLRETLPFWKPRIEPKVSREDYLAYHKRRYYGLQPPGAGEPLVLQHGNLGPEKLLVTVPSDPDEMPKLLAILAWHHIGHFPKYESASLARQHQDYIIQTEPMSGDNWDWRWMLSNALFYAGFPLELEHIKKRMACFLAIWAPEMAPEHFVTCDHLPIGYEEKLIADKELTSGQE